MLIFQQNIQYKKKEPKENTSLFDELASVLNLESPTSSFNPPETDLFEGPLDPESGLRRRLSEELDDMNGFTSSSLRVSCSSRFPIQINGGVMAKSQQRLQDETLLRKLSVEWSEESPSTPLREEPKHSVTWTTNIIPPSTERNTNSTTTFETSLPHFSVQNSFISHTDSLIGYHNGQWINRVQLRKRFVSFSRYSISVNTAHYCT
jgi:hypothetical protein